MPNNWKTYKLSDFIDINPLVKLKANQSYSFVEMKDLDANLKTVKPSDNKTLKGGAKFQNGDTLFARITPCLQNGKICQVRDLENNVAFGSTEFLVFRGKENISDSDFVYYLSREPFVRQFAEANMIGTSGRQRVAKEAFQNIELELPPIQEQKSIASILSAIDDKIENNLAINKTLEEMAMALYKHWFVDFGPFQDGEFVESELGRIPKGWEVKRLSECNELILGGTPSRKNESYWEKGTIGWLNSGKVNEFRIIEPSEYITQEALRKSSTKVMQKGTTVLAITGATLGQISRIEKDFCANQSVIGILKSDLFSNEYIYLWIHFAMEELLKLATGGAQQHVNKNNVGDLKIVYPSLTITNDFQNAVNDIFENISNNMFENQTLTQLRDTLLPKLISGVLRLKEFQES